MKTLKSRFATEYTPQKETHGWVVMTSLLLDLNRHTNEATSSTSQPLRGRFVLCSKNLGEITNENNVLDLGISIIRLLYFIIITIIIKIIHV